MNRLLSLLLLAALLSAPASANISEPRASDSATAPSTAVVAEAPARDAWLDTLTALLIERYRPAGDLVVAWNRPRPAHAPADADLSLVNAPADLAPQLLLTVRATTADGVSSDYTLVLRVEHWRDGWALREPAAIAAPVQVFALEPRRFDALRDRDALPADAASELDFARNVPAGRLLVWRDVLRRPLVRRNQPVDVSASSGGLTVTLRGIALHDAARGEAVRVRNPDSKKEFTALVTAEARASVRL